MTLTHRHKRICGLGASYGEISLDQINKFYCNRNNAVAAMRFLVAKGYFKPVENKPGFFQYLGVIRR